MGTHPPHPLLAPPGQSLPTGVEEAELDQKTGQTPEFSRKFAVIMLNDDYSPMDFVVEVLLVFFGKSEAEAVQIMLKVHNENRALCGIYTYEIAETKLVQVHDAAKERGYPLRCIMEPVELNGKGGSQ